MDKTNTPDEMLDVVNENDEVIGALPKKFMHGHPELVHREVRIYIFDENNHLFLQQRSSKKKVNPLVWSESCAGHVTSGMTPDDAAHMELKEELGIDTYLQYVGKKLIKSDTESRITYFYTGEVSSDTKFVFEAEEVEQGKFMTFEEIHEIDKNGVILGKFFMETIDMFKDRKKLKIDDGLVEE